MRFKVSRSRAGWRKVEFENKKDLNQVMSLFISNDLEFLRVENRMHMLVPIDTMVVIAINTLIKHG